VPQARGSRNNFEDLILPAPVVGDPASATLMVSRASWIARRNRTIHGEPCSSGREAMVPTAGRQDGCRLATALDLRRSTNRAAEIRTGGVPGA
jgi:hypothetical protein